MTPARALALAGKLFTKPPAYTLMRARQEAARVLWRPWTRVRPALFDERAFLRTVGAASVDAYWEARAAAPFFLNPSDRDGWAEAFRARWPGAQAEIVDAAARVLRHEFDLLGSGPKALGPRLPWHEDFKTGRVWPLQYSPDIEFSELDKPTDVKVPWELSRCQHVGVLGQAYWLTGDERYAQEYVDEITDWIARNPWGHGVNWICAMDVALRAVNWIWGFHFFAGSRACADPAFRGALLRSLHLHGEWVASHLEKGPVNGNHYLSDGVGLVFLGTFFDGVGAAGRWLETGRAIVLDEMLVQVTADGVDFEASTAYHRLVMELFLTAYLRLRHYGETIPDAQWTRLERMAAFVEAYVKPDGLAPLVGDADDGRVQILGRQAIGDHRYLLSTCAVLFGRGDFKRGAGGFHEESFWMLGPAGADAFDALAEGPGVPASAGFAEGGYYVLRDGATHVFIDCADVGMRGIGGHGHNDILSFELVLDGVPVVTDCGAYLYTASREWRNRFRSTAFHATIQVDGEEVNRFLGPDALWQLHADATPDAVSFRTGPGGARVRGAHLGYQRLPSPVRVQRDVALAAGAPAVFVADVLEGEGRHRVTWRFPLPPDLEPVVDGHDVRLARGAAERWVLPVRGHQGLVWKVEAGWVSPSYGVRHETRVLRLEGDLQLPHRLTLLFTTRWRSAHERSADLEGLAG
ncbi:MAG: alginate lyase family protein [Vicinamibacterales bacterium]|nr:alginate lyase family protein [Vicinamibacterales bacterium]